MGRYDDCRMAAARVFFFGCTMCGITGFINPHMTISTAKYYAVHLRLRHRGNDDEGFYVHDSTDEAYYCGDDTSATFGNLPHIQEAKAAHVVLGHRRLAIIDLSPDGHQPMGDPSGRYVMVYNGEIYNYIELRWELEKQGYSFQTQSDSEVLLCAFAAWGEQCFNRFNGMWALAIYDKQERRLLLSRDRFGIKPLYYAQVGETLYFGSEVKFLLPFLPTVGMNEPRVLDYLVRYVIDHHAETMFEGIHQLPPGYLARYDMAGLTLRSYWSLPEGYKSLTLEDAVDELSELLRTAIRLRLRSDVPVGSLLSGGLDSTTIVCLAREQLEVEGATNTFDLFSAVFHEETFSERPYIEDTVAQTELSIHWVYPEPARLAETLPQLLYHQEFPIRSLAVYSQWELMRKARSESVTVLLNGQGSDEIFGGYTAHYPALIAEYVRRGRLRQALNEGRTSIQHGTLGVKSMIQSVGYTIVKSSPLSSLFAQRSLPYLTDGYRAEEESFVERDLFRRALIRNLTYSALPEYLRYEDRNSMAFTLESRLPFLDYRLVEWAMQLPAHLKIHKHASKRVLRETARPFIPASIANRRDKMGFVSPQYQWQHNELQQLFDDVFQQDISQRLPFLRRDKVDKLYQRYRSQARYDASTGGFLWKVFCLWWWHKQWWGA